jgi:hypothetical protein
MQAVQHQQITQLIAQWAVVVVLVVLDKMVEQPIMVETVEQV